MRHGFWLGFIQYGLVGLTIFFFRWWLGRRRHRPRPHSEITVLKIQTPLTIVLGVGALMFWGASVAAFFLVKNEQKHVLVAVFAAFGLLEAALFVYGCGVRHKISIVGIESCFFFKQPTTYRWEDIRKVDFSGGEIRLTDKEGRATGFDTKYLENFDRFSELALTYIPPLAIPLRIREILSRAIRGDYSLIYK